MKYKIYSEPDYYWESLNMLSAIYNGTTAAHTKKIMLEKSEGKLTEDVMEPLFCEAIELTEHVRSNVPLEGDMADTLFKNIEDFGIAPCTIFYLYHRFLSKGIDNRFEVISAYVNNDYDKDSEQPDVTDSAGLFEYIDTSECTPVAKYTLLKIYYNFDRYYAYINDITERTSILIREQLGIFGSKLNRLKAYVSGELEKNGASFFRDKCKINILDDIEYDIIFSVTCLNAVHLSGSRYLNHRLVIGLAYFELMELVLNAKSRSETLIDFVKALSDNTKLSILQMLKTDSYFGSQLAEKLHLTSATISYHMSVLIRLGTVYVEKENNRMYYKLNYNKINEYLDELRSLLT